MGRYHGNSRDEHQTNARQSVNTPKPNSNSRPVSSNQTGLHPRLAETVNQAPGASLPAAGGGALPERLPGTGDQARQRWTSAAPGCLLRTGQSTAILAHQYPELLAVGVDQSAQRIQKHRENPSLDYMLLRASVEDIWQLLLADRAQRGASLPALPQPLAQGENTCSAASTATAAFSGCCSWVAR